MTNKNRIERLERRFKPKSYWTPPMIDVDEGHEDDPEYLAKLAEIYKQAELAGWKSMEEDGPIVIVLVSPWLEGVHDGPPPPLVEIG